MHLLPAYHLQLTLSQGTYLSRLLVRRTVALLVSEASWHPVRELTGAQTCILCGEVISALALGGTVPYQG